MHSVYLTDVGKEQALDLSEWKVTKQTVEWIRFINAIADIWRAIVDIRWMFSLRNLVAIICHSTKWKEATYQSQST